VLSKQVGASAPSGLGVADSGMCGIELDNAEHIVNRQPSYAILAGVGVPTRRATDADRGPSLVQGCVRSRTRWAGMKGIRRTK
jgi:hypothetical protein